MCIEPQYRVSTKYLSLCFPDTTKSPWIRSIDPGSLFFWLGTSNKISEEGRKTRQGHLFPCSLSWGFLSLATQIDPWPEDHSISQANLIHITLSFRLLITSTSSPCFKSRGGENFTLILGTWTISCNSLTLYLHLYKDLLENTASLNHPDLSVLSHFCWDSDW